MALTPSIPSHQASGFPGSALSLFRMRLHVHSCQKTTLRPLRSECALPSLLPFFAGRTYLSRSSRSATRCAQTCNTYLLQPF
eukprot:1956759-Pleurochrysis_carterae.AAC.3